jgi:surface carbohydrate biosynthesis protein
MSTLHKKEIEKKYYSSDFYFVFNNQLKKIIEKFIDTECIVAGSLKNNKVFIKEFNNSFTGNIGFISRFTLAILRSVNEKNEKNPDYIVHKFSTKLLLNTAEYCKKNKKKLMILTTKPSLLKEEKKYYNEILQNYEFEFLIKEKEYDSYHNLFKVDILISPSSTLGSEALGRDLKVLYFSEDKILVSNNFEYSNLEKMINYINNLSIDDWKKLLTKYSDHTCFFDNDNRTLKSLIKKILINSE